MAPSATSLGKRKLVIESITLSDSDDDEPPTAKATAAASTRTAPLPAPLPGPRYARWNNFTNTFKPTAPTPSPKKKPKTSTSSPKKRPALPSRPAALPQSIATFFVKPIASTSAPLARLPFPTGGVRVTRENEHGTLSRFKIEDLFGTGSKERALEEKIESAFLGSGEISASDFLWKPLGCETGELSKLLLLSDALLETGKRARKVNYVDMKKVKNDHGDGGRGRYNLHAKFASTVKTRVGSLLTALITSADRGVNNKLPSPFRLPRLATPFNDHASNTTKTPVFTSFHHFLTSLGVPPSRLEPFLHSLGSYDFSASSNVQLVHSHRGSSWSSHPQQTLNFGPSTSKGRCRRKALSRSNEAEASPGSLSRSMPSAPLPAEPGPSKPSGIPPREYARNRDPEFSLESIKVLFATEAEMAPLGGKDPTGNKPVSPSWYGGSWDSRETRKEERDARPQVLHRNECKEGQNQHTKSLVIMHKLPNSPPEAAFYYLGSHKVTTAAWGKITLIREKVEVEISQHELGVVVRVEGGTLREIEKKVDEMVGYRRPVRRYGERDRPYEGAGGDGE